MKIIFLDIDGVVNTSRPPATGPKPKPNQASIDALNLVIDQVPDARFVLSSRWRVDYGYQATIRYLKAAGFKGSFIGQTPNFDKPGTDTLVPRRRHEIQKYLDDNGIKNQFVIIDDNPDLGRLTSRQVQTRYTIGFTQSRVADVIRILNR